MKSTNLLVAQSGGPTAVINSTLAGIIQTARRSGQVGKIIGLSGGIEGLFNGRPPYDLTNLTDPQLEALRRSNGMALGSCRFAPQDEHYTLLLDFIKANSIRYFLYIG